MKLRMLHYSILGLLLSLSFVAYGASTDFTVRTLIGDDTTPPSVPTGLTATPVATSQINLSWNASTDDVLLSGYQVFRDDVQIATTSLTNYADTGLTLNTLYTYYVTAFDSFNNISASSTPVATTTFASTTPPVSSNGGSRSGSLVRLGELVSLEVIPDTYSVRIRYETSGYVRGVVRWGKSISYELGSVSERSFSTFHETVIDGLTPDTPYTFTIQGENHLGVFGTFTESVFRTLPLDDVLPPSNVTDLRATRVGDDVVLSWQNPEDNDFKSVRILRNDAFYPSDTADGWVVYEGSDETVHDTGAALLAPRQFYTVFTYDAKGNISSGAVVSIRLTGDTSKPVDIVTEVNPINLTLDMVTLYQEGVRIPFERGTAVINGGRHLTIAIPYDALPEHLKTILVTLVSPHDTKKELNFLLRVNKEKTAYVAYLAPLGVSGDFPLRISVFDFKTAQIGYVRGRITSEIVVYETSREVSDVSFFGRLIRFLTITHIDYVLVFIALLGILAFLARRLLHQGDSKSPRDTV